MVSSPFEPKIIDKQGGPPPSNLCAFKEGARAARLNKVAILPEYFDFCSKLDDTSRRERFARASYEVGHIFSILSFYLIPL